MFLTISKICNEAKSITFSEKDFGRKVNAPEEDFALDCPVEYFCEQFSSIYDQCIAELIRDDEITGEFHPPYLGSARYPTLIEFLTMAEDLRMQMLDTYFIFDILRIFFKEDSLDPEVQWEVKCINSLLMFDGRVFIRGRVIRR